MQKCKWLSEEALQIAEERRNMKGYGEKKKYTHPNSEAKNSKERYGSLVK